MILPLFKTEDVTLTLLQTKWASLINPFISAPTNQTRLISNVSLINGSTTINHGLGRMMQGWSVTDINGIASIYRSQPMNDLTLTLTSSAAVVISLEVF